MSNPKRPVGSVKKHTPWRKTLHQDVTSIEGKVRYLHVTKGWRVRTIVDQPTVMPIFAALHRAAQHKHSLEGGALV